MLWQFCLFSLAVILLVTKWKNRKLRKLANQLPSASFRKLPILGHAASLWGDCENLMRCLEQLGRDSLANDGLISAWMINKLVIVVTDPDVAEVVMKVCLKKDDLNNVTRELIGYGSIFAPVSIWRPRRKILAPIFSPKTLNSFVQIFSKQSHILLEKLEADENNGDVSIFDKVTRYSMDSVCETTLGTEVKSQSQPQHPVPQSFALHCKLAALRMVRPWYHSDAIYKWSWDYPQFKSSAEVLKQFVRKIIISKRENFEKTNANKKITKVQSLLDLLISSEDGKGFTDLELQEESLVVVLAGTDTSSVGASFAALLMAKHPEVQQKVYQEVITVLEDRPVQPEDLPKLKYLEAVVKETLRLYPPVPVVMKNPPKDVTLTPGVVLVPGSTALVHIWALHRNTKYWSGDADTFRPERFLEDPPTHPYVYIPFGRGPRMCLGAEYAMMSMKTVLASLVRRYRLLPPTAGFGSQEELPTRCEIMMKHVGNFQLQLQLRK
ncbi:cytochrome P450 4d8 [Amyelois transitella]|uniref:cytochrome P450 4d8 n=1 Tax=Amyelois transitella TaxID=680683 RepID=UPI00067DB6A8|nr:cytochrome P450 4d8 [Amyelois transitella]